VVVEVALHDRLEPLASLHNRVVRAVSELLLDFLKFGSHPFADRLDQELALTLLAMWPSATNDSVGVPIATFRSSIPSPPVPLFTLHCVLRSTQCKTRGRADCYSFLVRLSHPLLHTGFIPALHVLRLYESSAHHLIDC
jgi:hypothetical protein